MEVTLFEIHLDGAQFGPAAIGDEMMERMGRMGRSREMHEETTMDETSEGRRSRSMARRAVRFVPVVVVFAVAGYAARRRFRGGSEEMVDDDAEAVEIEA